MTIKDMADVAGVSTSTISRKAKEMFPLKFKNGVKTVLNQKEALAIMKEIRKINFVEPMQSEKLPMQIEKVQSSLTDRDIALISNIVTMSMKAILPSLMNEAKEQLKISGPSEDYFTLIAYCNIHGIEAKRSELPIHGRSLVKMSKEQGKLINKIPDERWGTVNSYPVDILNEYFSV